MDLIKRRVREELEKSQKRAVPYRLKIPNQNCDEKE